ncbi:MAG: DUF2284 domain-containing protein, partial [Candidatus Hecatellales archaeon]
LEGEAVRAGFPWALGLIGGYCCLCEECVGPGGKCLHPYEARPSMEALGINVYETCVKAGVPLPSPEEKVLWTGVLLV